jgi:hypothetical protein
VVQSVWIRTGSITAGSSNSPFSGNITFELTGNKEDKGFVINQDISGNKLFVVTGLLALYG